MGNIVRGCDRSMRGTRVPRRARYREPGAHRRRPTDRHPPTDQTVTPSRYPHSMTQFQGGLPLPALGRPARGHRPARRRRRARRPLPDPAGHHRIGQDGHDRLDDRAGPAAHARHRAEQVAGRPALLRAEGPAPQEPGRVLRLLLRLLPTRGLPADHRHLHREGLVDQRRDRPAPARHDVVAAHAAGHHRRRLGLVHLRPWSRRPSTGTASSP